MNKINGCWRNINDGGDNVIVITLEVIFYTTVAFEIKICVKTLSFIYIM